MRKKPESVIFVEGLVEKNPKITNAEILTLAKAKGIKVNGRALASGRATRVQENTFRTMVNDPYARAAIFEKMSLPTSKRAAKAAKDGLYNDMLANAASAYTSKPARSKSKGKKAKPAAVVSRPRCGTNAVVISASTRLYTHIQALRKLSDQFSSTLDHLQAHL